MRTRGFIRSIPLSVLAASVLAPPGRAGSMPPALEPFGLQGRAVTSLGIYGSLYAGTFQDGVFRRALQDQGAAWVSLGQAGRPIRAVYPHQSGALGHATTIGIEGNPLQPIDPLIYCANADQLPWVESDSGMTRADIVAVWSLDGFPSPAVCGETFATTLGSLAGVWRRAFGGTRWEHVLDIGFGVGNVVRADPVSGNVWAGGENAILAPWIARSTDLGDTWHLAYPDLAGDNACNTIALHPDDPDRAYAGMEGHVIVTEDGGVSWTHTGLRDTQAYIYGVALDSGRPENMVAGGLVRNPNSWALWESFDAGQTWLEVAPPTLDPPQVVAGIMSIVADPAQAGTFYLATNGHGVWRYRSSATGIDRPPQHARALVLEAAHPNPFNPQTTVGFRIPTGLASMPVHLAIYDARGALVRVLVDEALAAGPHQVTWNGKDTRDRSAPSGVYQVRLQVGPERRFTKVSLVR